MDKQTILIVDDQPINIQTLSNLLKDDYRIKIAPTGKKALEIARGESTINLILLDVLMPDIDEYEVCKRLKKDPETQNIPIIFITAKDSGEDEEKGLILGAIDYISKPYSPRVVKARVNNHMARLKAEELLKIMAMKDELTGLSNRRALKDHFEWCVTNAKRTKSSFSIAMLDLDHFKQVNDVFGHQIGDDVLRTLAELLKSGRQNDFPARFGGEEFVIILHDTEINDSLIAGEYIRKRVEDSNILEKHITVSIGLSTFNLKDATSIFDKLIGEADKALYHSKETGRNKVTHFSNLS